jgi:hypothetical protein
MARDEVWLNLPQAAILEATRDIDLTLRMTDDDPNLLLVKANRILATPASVPLEDGSPKTKRRRAYKQLQQELRANKAKSSYGAAERRVWGLLAGGLTVKAGRLCGRKMKKVDPAEFTRLEPRGFDAIDKRSGKVVFYDLRIAAFELLQKLRETAADGSPDQSQVPRQESSGKAPIWEEKGNPVPSLIDWAREGWGHDLNKLPNCNELLKLHRTQFGKQLGINEKTMRPVRRTLAPEKAKRGGAPTHRH